MTTYCSLKENLPDLSIIHLIKPIPGDSIRIYLYCIVVVKPIPGDSIRIYLYCIVVVKPSNFSEYTLGIL